MSKQRRCTRITALLLVACGVGLLAAGGAARASAPQPPSHSVFEPVLEPFGIGGEKLRQGALLRKWRAVSKAMQAEQKTLARCREQPGACPPEAKRFLALVDRALAREGRNRISEINRAINLVIRPVDDMTQYGVEEFWASPLTTFAAGAGDCEDYAIAKFAALREMGVTDHDLRLVVVRDRSAHDYHAVAAVRHEGRWLILDNRTFALREDAEIEHFSAHFVLDAKSVKRLIAAGPKSPVPTPAIMPASVPAVEAPHVAQIDVVASAQTISNGPVSPYLP